MKGDFSRGFQPDSRRGKSYRRVLLQQRRLLLDSDLAAMVDAQDRLVRGTLTGLGSTMGSPDLGFLITPGKLHALFDRIDGVRAEPGVDFYRDHDARYLGRYPSLFLRNSDTVSRQVWIRTIGSLTPGAYRLALWTQAESALQIEVSAGWFNTVFVPTSTSFQRVQVNLTVSTPAPVELAIRLPPGGSGFRIGLIESDEDSANPPYFWVAAGQYHLQGLTVENPTPQGYPEVSFPQATGFYATDPSLLSASPKTRFVAYLEAWERGITHLEDRGVREEALGGGQDTTVRTQAVGQIKLANAYSFSPDQVLQAFSQVKGADGTLTVDVQQVEPQSDPCALPMTGGYTGRDNRLYWIEVHQGGALGTAVLKWSRDNAAELYGVLQISGSTLTMADGSDLHDGDLVEVLSEVIDLGDSVLGNIASGQFVSGSRLVGKLAKLVAQPSDDQGRSRFRLVEVDNPTQDVVPNDPLLYGSNGARVNKVRRWHGRIKTQPLSGGETYSRTGLEDGITVLLRGTFEIGSYWQYEARRGTQNSNGTWKAEPHGPERFRVPLAILSKPSTSSQPMVLEAWLDKRFSRLSELDADDIPFQDEQGLVGEGTVQEAIEALLKREAIQSVQLDLLGTPVPAGAELRADQLAEGLSLMAAPGFDLKHATEANCRLTLELPFPSTKSDQEAWGTDIVGYQPITLQGSLSAESGRVRWVPTAPVQKWLLTKFSDVSRQSDAWEFYGTVGSSPTKGWEVGPQEQLVQQGTPDYSIPSLSGDTLQGFWAIHRQFAAHETVVLRSKWSHPLTSPITFNTGLVFDWRNSSYFSMVVYQYTHGYGGGGGFGITPYLSVYIRVFDVRNGSLITRSSQQIYASNSYPPSNNNYPFKLSFGPDGIFYENTGAPGTLERGSVAVKANLKGQRIGLFTTVGTEFWRLESTGSQGTQVLLPAAQPQGVRARLSLQRDAVRWTGRTSSQGLPFHKDFETWFWVLPSPASPYGYGGGLGAGFTGIGAGLLK